MSNEDSIPGQTSSDDAENEDKTSVNQLEWTIKNANLLRNDKFLTSSAESEDTDEGSELELEDSTLEQSTVSVTSVEDEKEKEPQIEEEDLEDVIELDRAPSPNKNGVYPTVPQCYPPTPQYQQQQYYQNGRFYQCTKEQRVWA